MWLYREHLAQAGVIEALFDAFDGSLKKRGYLAMGGQIIDASIVPVRQQRNSRDENARIKDGETPEGWGAQARTHGAGVTGAIECRYYGRDFSAGEMALLRRCGALRFLVSTLEGCAARG